MAMPSSGTITFAQLQTEFGGSNPISLSEYYRGGGLVPDIAANAAVPTSGAISLSNFYGAVNRTFGLAIGDIYNVGDLVVEASFIIARNGSPWTLPTETTIGDGYEVRVALNTGDSFTSTPAGWSNTSWHALTANRTWVLNNNVAGTTKSLNCTITVRIAGGGATVATETLNLTAEVNP